jgi:isocitrate dehydrogenase
VNPGSLILSGALMLEHMSWTSAAELIVSALSDTISSGTVTYDLARQMECAEEVSCSGFGRAIVERIESA